METISAEDRKILRDKAKRYAEIAAMPVQQQRIDRWKRHNALGKGTPMILVFPEGSWRELLPPSAYACKSEDAKAIEWLLMERIYEHDHFDQDRPITKDWTVGAVVNSTGWGLEPQWHFSDEATGARTFNPVISAPSDLKKLKTPRISVDEAASAKILAFHQDILGDILDVSMVGITHVSFHLMSLYTSLRGLEQVMMDMIENPEMLHEAMSILQQGHKEMIRQYIDLDLLRLNNNGAYHSSGGVGYTDELPQKDFSGRVRPIDMWASAESQELAQVSPEMHAEFALHYEKPLLAPFGLNGYGCCEDLTRKLDDVMTVPNMRRVSISPWANIDKCAEKLGGRAIYSWKPHPAHLAGGFHPDAVRQYIRHTLETCKANGCVLEMILKDTHTCDNHPERFVQWTKIAREEVQRLYS